MVDLVFEINRADGAEGELRANDAGPSELNNADSLRRVRAREVNGEDEVPKINGHPKFMGLGGMERAKLVASGSQKMCKEILIASRPTTLVEVLQTGLLEGYSVFYNGG
ncbi:hypothetical protein Salat_2556500 [Sesamum alatum]|uniref:Uncharacterized protein n=1 Tax=Sesamum alatum TaxID=300844 RepID=A0AAE1XSL8_9LAMI|nr:hypothetical protein Salat_2556500 [Sesamum alatum]